MYFFFVIASAKINLQFVSQKLIVCVPRIYDMLCIDDRIVQVRLENKTLRNKSCFAIKENGRSFSKEGLSHLLKILKKQKMGDNLYKIN